ncbi:MAG: endonuclease/exonuclease/phosphatase family protein [Pseudomonadota bacterium]
MVAPPLLFLFACTPLAGRYPDRADYPIRTADELTDATPGPDQLRVLTYNIKFGGARIDFFFDGWGDRVHMTQAEVLGNMEDIEALIEDLQPDLLLTQEVDVDSKRSAYVDQVDHILNHTDMNYAAWVPVWESAYIAEEGLGPMQMGQAVFSRYPITANERIALEPVGDQDPLTRYFYLDRCIQRVTVDLGAATIEVLNNHPDAYSTDGTKERQIQDIVAEAAAIEGTLIVGGDFNSVPPGTLNLTDFDDNAPVSGPGYDVVTYEEEGDLLMEDFYAAYQPAMPLEDFQVADQTPFFTHSIYVEVFWNRKLDYLFSTEPWLAYQTVQAPGDGTSQDPMLLSDHAPFFGVLDLSAEAAR